MIPTGTRQSIKARPNTRTAPHPAHRWRFDVRVDGRTVSTQATYAGAMQEADMWMNLTSGVVRIHAVCLEAQP